MTSESTHATGPTVLPKLGRAQHARFPAPGIVTYRLAWSKNSTNNAPAQLRKLNEDAGNLEAAAKSTQ